MVQDASKGAKAVKFGDSNWPRRLWLNAGQLAEKQGGRQAGRSDACMLCPGEGGPQRGEEEIERVEGEWM